MIFTINSLVLEEVQVQKEKKNSLSKEEVTKASISQIIVDKYLY